MFQTQEKAHGDTGEIPVSGEIKFRAKRFEPRGLYVDLGQWLQGLQIKEILSHQQSESGGYITVSIFYK